MPEVRTEASGSDSTDAMTDLRIGQTGLRETVAVWPGIRWSAVVVVAVVVAAAAGAEGGAGVAGMLAIAEIDSSAGDDGSSSNSRN